MCIRYGNVVEYVRKLCTDFGRREAPSAPYVRYLVKKTGILMDKPKPEKAKKMRTHENIAAVAENVCVKRHQHQFTVVLNN